MLKRNFETHLGIILDIDKNYKIYKKTTVITSHMLNN